MTDSFTIKSLTLSDAKIIHTTKYKDQRGHLSEIYLESWYKSNGIENDFIQDKFTVSKKDVLRGIHFQSQDYSQAKLIWCSSGEIYDVIVDLRKQSSTFLQWESINLSEDDSKILYVPKGFGHSYLTMEDNSHIHYKIDEPYAPDKEQGMMWDEDIIGIKWPTEDPILSEKDNSWDEFRYDDNRIFSGTVQC